MLSVSRNGYALYGLGDTVPFKCSATICYGSDGGATHALFKETQYQMNRAGLAVFGTGWSAIAVDGFIGPRTLTAAKKLLPKVPGLSHGPPGTFPELAKWISDTRTQVPDLLRAEADRLTKRPEPPQVIENRQDTYSKEGPAAGSAPQLPDVSIPRPNVAVPPTSQIPGNLPGAAPKSKAFVWVVVGFTTVGIVTTAALVARRRRR